MRKGNSSFDVKMRDRHLALGLDNVQEELDEALTAYEANDGKSSARELVDVLYATLGALAASESPGDVRQHIDDFIAKRHERGRGDNALTGIIVGIQRWLAEYPGDWSAVGVAHATVLEMREQRSFIDALFATPDKSRSTEERK